ncbi:phage integrase N-terminal SAM-like domain-containing protein [Thalassoglobus polymorphus]|uniref:phage integrase N-terminal SAM-like domain-containing protein n=1 Tax=Thalassoglobus polymorphus TaxID=2527994 RepID=UPI0011A8AABE
MRNKLRVLHSAWKTEQSCVRWIGRFLNFHRERNHGHWKHSQQMGKAEIEQCLTHLAHHLN